MVRADSRFLPCVAGAPAAVGMTIQYPNGVRFVESHLSQRTRKMGHPAGAWRIGCGEWHPSQWKQRARHSRAGDLTHPLLSARQMLPVAAAD